MTSIPIERILSKVDITDDCWLWTGSVNSRYGRIRVGDTVKQAHRVVYEMLVEDIPPDHDLDHLCRNPICVNPDHLEPVDHRENVLRGVGPTAVNAAKTHCHRGHEFTAENTYRWRGGGRQCRACRGA